MSCILEYELQTLQKMPGDSRRGAHLQLYCQGTEELHAFAGGSVGRLALATLSSSPSNQDPGTVGNEVQDFDVGQQEYDADFGAGGPFESEEPTAPAPPPSNR